ncbi:cytochrome P450 4c3 [Caerostris extrusa]|uniref:Cytochrome P450 4c3 n=1 Tax=Caerostris extrusa TaxID=172846 RepID=A0AAV4Q3L6_CAEEX|nr:cytochrome P450 4c3 [Caerostris extrusa]
MLISWCRRRFTSGAGQRTLRWELSARDPLSVADLNEFKYLECVLKTPSSSTCNYQKTCNYEDISICGHTIPKRTHVIVAPFFVHREEDVFPDPEKFDPDRFLPESSSHIPECAYIPFAAGPSDCIGRIFAEMEVKILVCHILRNFSSTLWTRGTKRFPSSKSISNRLNPPASNFDVDNSELFLNGPFKS